MDNNRVNTFCNFLELIINSSPLSYDSIKAELNKSNLIINSDLNISSECKMINFNQEDVGISGVLIFDDGILTNCQILLLDSYRASIIKTLDEMILNNTQNSDYLCVLKEHYSLKVVKSIVTIKLNSAIDELSLVEFSDKF